MIRPYALSICVFVTVILQAAPPGSAPQLTQERLRNLPLAFERNTGRAHPAAEFVAQGGGYGVALSHGDAHISLRRTPNAAPAAIDLGLEGARQNLPGRGRQALPGKVNYFIGNDPSRWRTDIPTFGRVQYSGVYPGVDLAYYGRQGRLEYDFVVGPGADPSTIRIAFHGAQRTHIDSGGDLILETGSDSIRFRKPVSYQQIAGVRRPVRSSYRLSGSNHVEFALGPYDRRYPLTVDPSLVYSTYLGGSAFDYGTAIAVNSSGNAFVTGYTSSLDFPTDNPEQSFFPGSSAIFVAKLATNGGSLVYATYLGGSGYNYPYGIAVDSTGAAYLTGLTESSDFPLMKALDSSLNGGEDAFITKFSPAGNSLVYSTYLGGSGADYALGIAVDSSHNVYVAGSTQSTDFPTTAGAYQTTPGGACSFVASLNSAGSALNWSTYFGQSCSAQTTAIAVDSHQAVYVTGSAFPGLPVTAGAPQSSFGGGEHDAFVAKLASGGASLSYCTYLGGSLIDSGTSVAVDASGDAYVTGLTQSTDLPVTGLALQPTSGGGYDAFVAELNSAGTAWQYVTYLGGQRDDYGYGIVLDSAGDAYIAGYTISDNLPVASAVQPSLSGNQHVLLKSTNSGKSWTAADTGLSATPAVIAVDPASEAHWIAATAEGLYQSPDSGVQWQATSGFVGASMYGVAFSPSGGTVYASNFTEIYSSQDSGNTWTFAGVAPCAAANLAVSPSSPTTLFLGYSCGAQSIDGGQTWTILNDIPGAFFNTMVIDPVNSSLIYAGTSSGLYASTDGGSDWSPLNIANVQYPNVTSVAIDPAKDSRLYAVANGSVYGSTDTGAVWKLESTGLTAQVNAVALAPAKPTVLYAATTAGVFISTDSAKKWKAAGETTDSISLIAADPVSSTTAYAATSVNPDAFVAEIGPGGATLVYSTYLGGTGLDYALGVALNSSGNIFVTGSTQSPDFPSTSGALQTATGLSRSTAFVAGIEAKTNSCAESVSPGSAFFYPSAGSANFSVVAPSGCTWTPKAGATWIKIGSHGGPGAGPLAISVAANTGATRTGSVTIGKDKVTVTQAANGCTYSLSTYGLSFPQAGGPQQVGVTAGSGCEWVVTGLPLWLTVTSGASGTGNGTVTLTAAPNPFPQSRGGLGTIANSTVGANQNGTSQ
ncbi:MAG: SBBP repeat-containing protein [Bryobacteraceae bacterium]